MSRQRREDQHFRLVQRCTRFLEMKQLAKRFVEHYFLDNFNRAAINFNMRNLECGTRIALTEPQHQFKAGGQFVSLWRIRNRRKRVAKCHRVGLRPPVPWLQDRPLQIVHVVKHFYSPEASLIEIINVGSSVCAYCDQLVSILLHCNIISYVIWIKTIGMAISDNIRLSRVERITSLFSTT